MKKMEISQMENLQGGARPFIGSGPVRVESGNGCYKDCVQDYFFWIKVGDAHNCQNTVCPAQF